VTTFLLVLVVFCFMVGAMSVGLVLGRKPLKGSCGGINALGMDTACEICGGDRAKCEKENEPAGPLGRDLGYDAMDVDRDR